MKHDKTFRACIIISALAHFAIFYPWPFLPPASRPDIRFQRLELTYFHEGPVKEPVVKDIKPVTSLERNAGKAATGAQKEKTDARRRQKKAAVDTPPVAETYQAPMVEAGKITDESKSAGGDSDPQEEAMLNEYRLAVRERIKAALEKNGKNFLREGEVRIKFVIGRDGALKGLFLYKSSRKDIRGLESIAINSIKEASPFPPFDKGISMTEIPFSIPIRFTLRP